MGNRRNPILLAVLAAGALLALTADERPYGLVTDGQIMTRTAFSIAEFGELGIAQGHPVNLVRPEGDAVTRYGLGPSLVQVPIAFVAGGFAAPGLVFLLPAATAAASELGRNAQNRFALTLGARDALKGRDWGRK